MEVEMKIRGLMMDPMTNMPIVVLKDTDGETVLPIWVGIYEANAIALEIEKVSTPRPMTHDLIKNLLTGLDARVPCSLRWTARVVSSTSDQRLRIPSSRSVRPTRRISASARSSACSLVCTE